MGHRKVLRKTLIIKTFLCFVPGHWCPLKTLCLSSTLPNYSALNLCSVKTEMFLTRFDTQVMTSHMIISRHGRKSVPQCSRNYRHIVNCMINPFYYFLDKTMLQPFKKRPKQPVYMRVSKLSRGISAV